jgi:hypothetical protein
MLKNALYFGVYCLELKLNDMYSNEAETQSLYLV